MADARETPGKISQILTDSPGRPGPFLWPKYFRESGNIHTVAFAGYGPAYFIDANRNKIYRTDGISEETVFSHSTYVRDLAFDSRSRLYFSEATGAGNDGVIYRLIPHTGSVTRYLTVPLEQLDGFWAGHFAFDLSGRLFISSGNRIPASIYQYTGGRFRQRFSHGEPITGFTFVDDNVLLFTNHRQRLYRLTDFRDLSVEHEEARSEWLNDVAFVRVPDEGRCQLSGRVRGGEELWPITSVEVFGPNVIWRRSAGGSLPVTGDGTFNFRNLPVGRYRIRTDLRGDSPVGFEPESHTVSCPSLVGNINFRYPE